MKVLRACLKIARGAVFAQKAVWRGATKENILHGSSTEEQRSQTAFCAKTLRAAGLLPVACVGSVLTARFGDARTSPPWPQPKSLAAAPLAIFKQALRLVLGLALASALQLSAQVSVEVVLAQEQFLSGESLPIAVQIKNRSGQTLHLGDDAEWLSVSVESRDGFIVLKNGEVPVLGEFDLESSKTATKRLDVSPYFTLPKTGRYSITATVRIKGWNTQIASKPTSFDIINGALLWSQEFGVPSTGSPGQAPEVRKFTLEQANYLRSQLRLYFRLTDASGSQVFKVVPIGPMVSFGQPEAQMDKLSNLHVLYQNGPRTFSYHVFNTDGEVLMRRSYGITNTRPRLKGSDDGSVSVSGGQRRVSPDDVPRQVSDAKPATTSK
jgi:hypothetical protein